MNLVKSREREFTVDTVQYVLRGMRYCTRRYVPLSTFDVRKRVEYCFHIEERARRRIGEREYYDYNQELLRGKKNTGGEKTGYDR